MTKSIRRRRVTAASPTPAKLGDFLRHLGESGSVSAAAARAGIARNTVYQRRKADPDFALGWKNAMEMAADALRDTAIARAREGDNLMLMFLLRTLKPEIFWTGPKIGPALCEFLDRQNRDSSCLKIRPPMVHGGRTTPDNPNNF
ncbi:MAG: hypothetical protein Q8K93_04640 [Reyranella sp.]|nr:hypothetical protein [Reyranella sp.]